MAWPSVFQRGSLLSRFSHHHVVVFLLTFFSYSLLHASRKTFSNVKVSISEQWTPSAFNTSVELPVEIWSSNHLFPSAEKATLFLGTLDTIFLFSYAVGLFISGIVGDRLNLRWVLSFGMCSSAFVVCLWHAHRMAAFLQQMAVLLPVDCERPAAVHWLALCGCYYGQLVWESRELFLVSGVPVLLWATFWERA
uniref:Solute carrier family 37 member 3 n=1 Tax=Macaca fascicularis TaxID=9541 RepID=A0A2K5WNZ6_MACFA